MALKFAILGFLRTTPRSGYDLARRFKDTMGGLVWMASLSQIYPELRRLEQAGLISGEVERGERLDKRVYRLTDEGRRELQRWVESAIDPGPVRDVERLQFLLQDSSPPDLIRKHLLRHREHYAKRLAVFHEKLKTFSPETNPLLRARLAVTLRKMHPVIIAVRRAALDGDVRRARLEIEWADSTLRALDVATRRPSTKRSSRAKGKNIVRKAL